MQRVVALLAALVCVAVGQQVYATNIGELEGSIEDILWLGPSKENVFLRTDAYQVYFGASGGQSFAIQNPKMHASDSIADNGKLGIRSVIVHPKDSNRMFLLGQGMKHWTTANGGNTYTEVHTPYNVDGGSDNDVAIGYTGMHVADPVRLHPIETDWILAALASPGCSVKGKRTCYRALYTSVDFGVTWTPAPHATYVKEFGWAAEIPGSLYASDTIYMTQWPEDEQVGRQKAEPSPSISLMRTSPTEGTELMVPGCNYFTIDGKYLLAGVLSAPGELDLSVSTSSGAVFEGITLPPQVYVQPMGYEIVDTASGAIFMQIKQDDGWGDLYVSNSIGQQFSRSLQSVYIDDTHADFGKMLSLDGVFVANVLTNPKTYKTQGPILQTRISYDNGGNWHWVQAPENPKKSCQLPTCALHLHRISTSPMDGFDSPASAIGMMIAQGNIGPTLDNQMLRRDMYLTRDGGLTWKMVFNGPYHAAIGDQGAIIVMVMSMNATRQLWYSWDEGAHWQPFTFADTALIIDEITTEPGTLGHIFFLYGRQSVKNIRSTRLFVVDFSAGHPEVCGSSDYELWTPSDGTAKHDRNCFMGQSTTYRRKIPSHACYNSDADGPAVMARTACPCDQDDYECDFDYERDPTNPASPRCTLIAGVSAPSRSPPADCPSGKNYIVTNGYRRVAGDKCDPTGTLYAMWEPSVYSCPTLGVDSPPPPPPTSSGGGAGIAVVAILAVVFVLGAGFFCLYRSGFRIPPNLFGGHNPRSRASYRAVQQGEPLGLDDEDEEQAGPELLADTEIMADLTSRVAASSAAPVSNPFDDELIPTTVPSASAVTAAATPGTPVASPAPAPAALPATKVPTLAPPSAAKATPAAATEAPTDI